MVRRVLLAAFVVSGAAGLIYESVWTRYLGLFVGHSAYAQIIVLSVFLGGMAIGSYTIAQWSDRIARPLAWYAAVELATAIIGFAFHWIFVGVTNAAYASVFPVLAGPALIVVKWSIAALLILPQSILLGATFPLMSAGAMRAESARGESAAPAGRILSLFYFANSLGAAAGVLVAGFALIAAFGLPGTLMSAAIGNVIAGAIAYAVSRTLPVESSAAVTAAPAEATVAGPSRDAAVVARALIVVAAGTAIASFVYEISWVRMLSLVLGSATHSFELMLSAFILGLALGAWWIRRRADTFGDPLRALAIVQWVMGVLALATVPLYLMSFGWTAWLINALERNASGYTLYTLGRYGFCLAVMLPATFCAGMTLPLITRTLMATGAGERAIGTVYGVNTFGSIIGAALAGVVLVPAVGLKTTLLIGASVDIALGVYVVMRFYSSIRGSRRLFWITAGGGVVVVMNIAATQHFDHGVLTSGVFRYAIAPERNEKDIPFYRDGRTATVSVRGDDQSSMSLATNGKPDASLTREWLHPLAPSEPRGPIGGDQVTQAFLPLITLAYAPHAQTAAVIGFGSGVSSHFLLGSPELKHLYTVEIEPAMAQASRLFHAANSRVYDDPRSTIVFDDAKSYFAAAGRTFDLVMSEPSNPWVSGVSGLFTDEFYGRVKRYLAPDGVFGQWLHLYEIDDPLVESVLAAVHRNFPAYAIYFTSSVDILIVATPAKTLRVPDWAVAKYPKIADDLARFRQLTPDMFDALRVTDRAVLAPLLDTAAEVNSDYHPLLDLGTEATRFNRSQASAIVGLGNDRFPIGLVLAHDRTPFGVATQTAIEINRAEERALGAALRTGFVPPDTGSAYSDLRHARHRLAQLRARLASGPPEDWDAWLKDVLAVDDDLHGGVAGVADESFFRDVQGYAQQYRAPERARAALAFMRAISEWDWATADSVGETVLALGSEHAGLAVDADLLRDGLVIAHLERNDPAGARRAFTSLSGYGERGAKDVRVRLLNAWIQRAEHAAAKAASQR